MPPLRSMCTRCCCGSSPSGSAPCLCAAIFVSQPVTGRVLGAGQRRAARPPHGKQFVLAVTSRSLTLCSRRLYRGMLRYAKLVRPAHGAGA